MANDPFDNMTDEERAHLFMYMISNQDNIRAKMEQWFKEAEEANISSRENEGVGKE